MDGAEWVGGVGARVLCEMFLPGMAGVFDCMFCRTQLVARASFWNRLQLMTLWVCMRRGFDPAAVAVA